MNKILFKIHRVVAFILCLPLLLICLSGSALVFKYELDSILMPERVSVVPATSVRQPFDTLLNTLNRNYPQYEITGWQVFTDPNRADLVYVMAHGGSDWSSLFVDPYSARALSPPRPPQYYFSDALREFHYQFLMNDTGLFICAVIAVLMCLQAMTGLILHRKFWKVLFTFRHWARPIIYLGDTHKLIGVLASPVLLVLGVTGAYWNVSQLIYSANKPLSEPYIVDSRLYNSAISLDALVADGRQKLPGFTLSFISLPSKPGYAISLLGKVENQKALYSEFANTLSYNAQSGEFMAVRDIREAAIDKKITNSFRKLHFGDFAGLASRLIWAVVGLSPLVLVLSGLSMYCLRRPVRKRAADKRKQG
jgi:uncharacterized iron-regulated membrane protein